MIPGVLLLQLIHLKYPVEGQAWNGRRFDSGARPFLNMWTCHGFILFAHLTVSYYDFILIAYDKFSFSKILIF